jgi:D-xylose transport system substrate-binding protein
MKNPPIAAAVFAVFAVFVGALLASSCSGDGKVSEPQSTAAGTAATIEGAQVGFILPDSNQSGRWETFDRPFIAAACRAASIKCDIQNANGDGIEMSAIADSMLAAKVRVLAIANLNSPSAVAIQERAAAQGVKLIDYDRLTVGGKTDVFVSFDNVAIGKAQGEGIITCLGGPAAARGKRIVQLHGSPTSMNATLWKQGYQNAIKGLGIKTVAEEAVPDSDNQRGGQIFEQLLAKANGNIDGVLVATDGLSLAAQAVLTKSGLFAVPTTGQDASPESLAAILNGTQCMTVYKPVRAEAEAVVAAAVSLLKGEPVAANATIYDGTRDLPYVQVQVTPIFKDQVKDVVADGFVTKAELCTGDVAAKCTEAGVE